MFNTAIDQAKIYIDAIFGHSNFNLTNARRYDQYVTDVVRQCHYHIRALKHIRPLLTLEASNTFAVSIVGSKLDYCNCVLYGISQTNLDKLQRVQNVLARVTAQAPWSVSATDLR